MNALGGSEASLAGKVALVTGGSSGIGLATALAFVGAGARVVITGQNPDRLAQAAGQLGAGVTAVQSDSGSLADGRSLAERIARDFGGLDVLFLNAGIGKYAALGDVEESEFDLMFNTNVKGPLFLVKLLAPHIRPGGAITFISSITNRMGMPESVAYAASKGAIASMMRVLAGELAGQEVRVNAIAPGGVATNMAPKLNISQGEHDRLFAKLTQAVPMGRIGKPEEIAAMALFLSSDAASYITGQEFVVDGGWTGVMA